VRARGILGAYRRFLNKDGLVEVPHGWNYMDWVSERRRGIAPQLGPLTEARGRLVHPTGFIVVDLAMKDGRLAGKVRLPKGVTGVYVSGGKRKRLHAGVQMV
jgi:hypothetical protein